MVIWLKWEQLCPENHPYPRATTCSCKYCELPHSKKCQTYFSIHDLHLLEWGTAQSMVKCGDPAQILTNHVTFTITWCFQSTCGSQDLYKNSINTQSDVLPLPSLSALVSPQLLHAWFMGFSGWERHPLFLSSLTQIKYIFICVNVLIFKSLDMMLYILFVFLQSCRSHQHTHQILLCPKFQPQTSTSVEGRILRQS